MRQRFVRACAALLISACRTVVPTPEISSTEPDVERVRAIAYRGDGALAAVVENAAGCQLRQLGPALAATTVPITLPPLITCEAVRLMSVGNEWVASDARNAVWAGEGGLRLTPPVFAATAKDNLVNRYEGRLTWIVGEQSLSLGATLSSPQILADGGAVIAIERTSSGSRLVRVNRSGTLVVLTPFFADIESFALDPKGKEVAFSAKRDTFDIGLVSTSGSDISWVGPEASDEVEVTWAPRGNKVTYVVKQFGGTTFRTVHIPTGYQVAADFADVHAGAVAWEPQAERFAVIVSSPLATEHVQSIRYGGEERRVVIAPAATLEGSVEALVIGGISAVVVTPPSIRYGQRYPLVVYKSPAPLAWHHLSVLQGEGAGIIIVPARATLTSEFWNEVSKLTWVDASRKVIAFAGKRDVVGEGVSAVARLKSSTDSTGAMAAVSEIRKRLAMSTTN